MDTIYQKPKDISLKKANDILVTFAFTRHPFSRLVSGFVEKMVRQWRSAGEGIIKLRSQIMIKYGTPNHERNSDDSPTPKMFVTYLLDTVKEAGPLSINRHWRPQYALCPFCTLNFDYIAAIEDMDTHMAFLANLFRFPVIFKEKKFHYLCDPIIKFFIIFFLKVWL
jgi:hypothetical protein